MHLRDCADYLPEDTHCPHLQLWDRSERHLKHTQKIYKLQGGHYQTNARNPPQQNQIYWMGEHLMMKLYVLNLLKFQQNCYIVSQMEYKSDEDMYTKCPSRNPNYWARQCSRGNFFSDLISISGCGQLLLLFDILSEIPQNQAVQ